MEAINTLEGETYLQYINRILESRPNEKIEKGQDHHHILPRAHGGTDEESNLIWLYRSEHAKAHYLYSKEHPDDRGMVWAAYMLCHRDGVLLTDEEMNELAKNNAELASKYNSGENNPRWGADVTEETRKKISESLIGMFAGEKNPMYGVRMCGENSPRYGVVISKE